MNMYISITINNSNTNADSDICIRDDNQGFQKYGYDSSDCSSGQPKLN